MSRRKISPNGRTSDRKMRADDSSDDLRRYQECAKKLDECSKNLLRLCQVSGEINNLHEDEIERAANEIMRTEEEEAKKIAAELLHQKGLLHRAGQEQEETAVSYLNQEDCEPRPRSAGVPKSKGAPSERGQDFDVSKAIKNCQDQLAMNDQRPNVHKQVINQPPYAIFHCEERVPCPPSSLSNQQPASLNRQNPCTDYPSNQIRGQTVPSNTPFKTPITTKGEGSDRGPPFFRQAQQQPPQSTWGRPEPVWNSPINRKTDPSGLSNPRLLDQCAEPMKKLNETTANVDPLKRNAKPQTIRLTAGAGRSADPPVHIVITAIANDCSSTYDSGPQLQPQFYPRDPVYSDNDFAEESGYSLNNKGPSTIYSSPTGDDRVNQKYLSQQKLVDRGSDAYVCPDDTNPSSLRPTYKEIFDTILSQRPHDAESLLNSKDIVFECRITRGQQPDRRLESIYECKETPQYSSQGLIRNANFSSQNIVLECDQILPQYPIQGSNSGANFSSRKCRTDCNQVLQNNLYSQNRGANCDNNLPPHTSQRQNIAANYSSQKSRAECDQILQNLCSGLNLNRNANVSSQNREAECEEIAPQYKNQGQNSSANYSFQKSRDECNRILQNLCSGLDLKRNANVSSQNRGTDCDQILPQGQGQNIVSHPPQKRRVVCEQILPQYSNQGQTSSANFSSQQCRAECDQVIRNLCLGQSQNYAEAPMKKTLLCCTQAGSGGQQRPVNCPPRDLKVVCRDHTAVPNDQGNRPVLLKCCQISAEAKRKQLLDPQGRENSRSAMNHPGDVMEKLRQYRGAPNPREDPPYNTRYAATLKQSRTNQRFGEIPQREFDLPSQMCPPSHQLGALQNQSFAPKSYQCTQVCPPSSNPSTLICDLSPPVNRVQSKSKIKVTEMDSSILLAIAKAAINLSLEKQQEDCEDEEEIDEDCDSAFPDTHSSTRKELTSTKNKKTLEKLVLNFILKST
ncbi:hypothetical protein GE061_006834 [Apolygus lucorum]|uniref:Uncharacterized protein n=1 Tax=Apolygus lucorum TaxID=248454 RepID=A0A8S9WRS3_APOLU|nr:hypothetical protein GE061_006834 [Apolygus lucorum]